jgi:hypothetical protein
MSGRHEYKTRHKSKEKTDKSGPSIMLNEQRRLRAPMWCTALASTTAQFD